MNSAAARTGAEEALDRIEGTVLPGITLTLEALLDAARIAQSGGSHAARAAELRTIALQLSRVVRELETATNPGQAAPEWPLRISA
jgi:hypothetical protein